MEKRNRRVRKATNCKIEKTHQCSCLSGPGCQIEDLAYNFDPACQI